MSAFILSDLHTFTIAEFIANRLADKDRYLNPVQFAQDLANRLKRANVQSVNYRYNEKTPARKCSLKQSKAEQYSPADIYRLCRCWIYQSCEDSNALDFLALNALLNSQFTEHEKEQAKNGTLWAI